MAISKKLFLCGPIGCGKSTMLQTALGPSLAQAGGFLTRRRQENGQLLGFELAPPDGSVPGQLFLDFSKRPPQNNAVFAGLGVALLAGSRSYPFCIADEFGGLELLVPEFYQALTAFLRLDVPCVGVIKSEEACRKLLARVPLDSDYPILARQLRTALEQDPDTLVLPTTGWQDKNAVSLLKAWTKTYIENA